MKGVWQDAAAAGAQEVLAWEIKMQGDVPTTGPSPARAAGRRTCMINGGRAGAGIELEGHVAGGALATFMMNVNGNRASGPVNVQAGAAALRCNGPNARRRRSARRVVTGGAASTSAARSPRAARRGERAASEVKVQN